MLRLPDSWVWDFWLADDGERYHLFFLFASRALGDTHRRHARASIGHAISDDLVVWERVVDALVRSDPPAPDDVATWTGSIVRNPDGAWHMFYTGLSVEPAGLVQQICLATSDDLCSWDKQGVVLRADARWHECMSDATVVDGLWASEHFRDPWVFADPAGRGWHMLVTARAARGVADERGIIAHAWSPDLHTWEHRPPLSRLGQGFGQLEVPQVEVVDGRAVLLFACLDTELSHAKRATGATGGTWYLPTDSLLGPYDVAEARALTDRSRYSGRLFRDRAGQWQFLSFLHDAPDGAFVGAIDDPRRVRWAGDDLVLEPPVIR